MLWIYLHTSDMRVLLRFFTVAALFISVMFAFIPSAGAAKPFMQGTATWVKMPEAVYYHVYYKETGETKYTHSVVKLPSTATSVLITHLKPGVRYWYNVVAVDARGKELKWSGLKKLRVVWMP